MATEKMTIRMFLENVVNAEISDEMTAFALERISKLDEKNEKKKSANSAKKVENTNIKAEILEKMELGQDYRASEIGEMFGFSTQKASALMVQLAKEGKVTATEIRIKGKGKVKAYAKIETETDETETETDETETETDETEITETEN